MDTDGDSTSNPTALTAVAVNRVGIDASGAATRYVTLKLAVEVLPDAATVNPAGTEVRFQLWNAGWAAPIERSATADAWGAASVSIGLQDDQLAGSFSYQAEAAGYGATPLRSASFASAPYSHDTRIGAAQITTTVAPDGKLIATLESAVPLQDAGDPSVAGLAWITIAQLSAADAPGSSQQHVLPRILAEPLDRYRAQAEVYLEPGRYVVMASTSSGAVQTQSLPNSVAIPKLAAPPIGQIEAVLEQDATTALVQYRTPLGDAALRRHPQADLPAANPSPAPLLRDVERIGAFRWQTEVYSLTQAPGHPQADARQSLAPTSLDYDPVLRRYTITLAEQAGLPLDRQLQFEILDVHGSVIYQETASIQAAAHESAQYQIVVPADRGQPHGLRILTPESGEGGGVIDWLVQPLKNIHASFEQSTGLEIDAYFGDSFNLDLIGLSIVGGRFTCSTLLRGCEGKFTGLIPDLLAQDRDEEAIKNLILDGLKQYIYDTFNFDNLRDSLTELGGIRLGSLGVYANGGVRFSQVFSRANCQSNAAYEEYLQAYGRSLELLTTDINNRLLKWSPIDNFNPLPDIPMPAVPFLILRTNLVFGFRTSGGLVPEQSRLFFDFELYTGMEALLVLGLPNPLDYLKKIGALGEGLAQIGEIINTLQWVGTLVEMLKQVAAGAMSCTPPPPNGFPDDRRDAFRNQLSPNPTGNSGNLVQIQQALAAAQKAQLPLATTYWTLELRQQELASFSSDTARFRTGEAERQQVWAAGKVKIQALIDGTTLPNPGQTLTETAALVFDESIKQSNNTSYDRELNQLLDQLEFARRNYAGLRGQELELARQLRQVSQRQGLGVLDGGLVTWALGAIGSLGITAQPVRIVAGATSSGLPSPLLSPYEAPRALIVPSGGLNRFRNTPQARDWLEAYVAGGGTLIVLAQAEGADWALLPGGEVTGLGYDEDVLCKTKSVRVASQSAWIAGVGTALPDIQIDGSFMSWPSNATIDLVRTTGTQLPAMLEYTYGSGRVIATTAYPDFYVNGMQSVDDIVFARSLFGQAFLEASGQTPVVRVQPTQRLQFALVVTNTLAISATQVTLWRDYFGQDIGGSWRWGAHQPSQLQASQIVNLSPPLAAGMSRSIAVDIAAPPQNGLFRMGYFLGQTSSWAKSGTIPGPFYEVIPSGARPPVFQLQQSAAQYQYGATAVLSATIANTSAQTHTFSLQPVSGIQAPPTTLVVGPHSSSTTVYSSTVMRRTVVRFTLREAAQVVGQQALVLRLRAPALGVSGVPDQIAATLSTTLLLSATVADGRSSALNWQLRRNRVLLAEWSSPLVSAGAYSATTTPLILPAANPGSYYTLQAALPDGTAAVSHTVRVALPAKISGAMIAEQLAINEANPSGIKVLLRDIGRPGTVQLQASLRSSDQQTLIAQGSPVSATVGSQTQNLQLDLPLPATLPLTGTYSVVVALTGQLAEATAAFSDSYALPLPLYRPIVELATAERRPGEVLTVLVRPAADSARLPGSGSFSLTLRGYNTGFVQTTTFSNVALQDNAWRIDLPIPEHADGGYYTVEVATPSLPGWVGARSIYVPPYKLQYTMTTAGSRDLPLLWTATNIGGARTTIRGRLTLVDQNRVAVAEAPVVKFLAVGSALTVPLTVPAQIASGDYYFRWDGTDHNGLTLDWQEQVTIAGLDLTLASATEHPAYLATDAITTTSVISNLAVAAPPLSDAQLRLQVVSHRDQEGRYQGLVNNLAGTAPNPDGIGPGAWFGEPEGLSVSADGRFALIVDSNLGTLRRLDLATNEVQTLRNNLGAYLEQYGMRDVALSPDATWALISNSSRHVIQRLDLQTGVLSVVAGTANSLGSADGTGAAARFNYPHGIAISSDGSFALVADTSNNRIRHINLTTMFVKTIAGGGVEGSADGTGTIARFKQPFDIVISPGNNLAFVSDTMNFTIRRLALNGANPASVTTIAGLAGNMGSADGALSFARFNKPEGVAISPDSSELLIADARNHTIRRLQLSSGLVSTLVGTAGVADYNDGAGAAAGLEMPHGVVFVSPSVALITDGYNAIVRQIDLPTRRVTTLAGFHDDFSPGSLGRPLQYSMDDPVAIALSRDNRVGLVIGDDSVLRRLDVATGLMTPLAGKLWEDDLIDGVGEAARFDYSQGLALNADGSMGLVADSGNYAIRKVDTLNGVVSTLAGSPGGGASVDGTGAGASFDWLTDVAMTPDGRIAAVTDQGLIRRIDVASGQVTTVAGGPAAGWVDGVGAAARFNYPTGIALSTDGAWALVADKFNHTIRRVDMGTGAVTTIAGKAPKSDGIGPHAVLNAPNDAVFSADGSYALVVDTNHNLIRRFDPATNAVTRFAGNPTNGYWGSNVDGTGDTAGFGHPSDIAWSSDRSLAVVVDEHTYVVRKLTIAPDGAIAVTTLAGKSNTYGTTDGIGSAARFYRPNSVVLSPDNSYALVTDYNAIRRVTLATGQVTTVAGLTNTSGSVDGAGSVARFYGLADIEIMPDGSHAVVADRGNSRLRFVQLGATGTLTVAGGINLTYPSGITISADNSFALVTSGTHTIYRVNLLTSAVTLVAGTPGQRGFQDGSGSAARFDSPTGITLHPSGQWAIVADLNNDMLRKLDLSTYEVTTLAGRLPEADGVGDLARFDYIEDISISADGAFAVATEEFGETIRWIDLETFEVTTVDLTFHALDNSNEPYSPGDPLDYLQIADIALSGDGRFALVADDWETLLLRVDLSAPRRDGKVLYERWQPVAGSGVLSYTVPLGDFDVLGESRARGELWLEGTLFSSLPTAATSGTHHILAASRQPFIINDTYSSLDLYAGQATYRANDPALAVDDAASAITLVGQVRNTSATTSPVTLTLERFDGAQLFATTFAEVEPAGQRTFSVTDQLVPTGLVSYTLASSLGDETSASVLVRRPEVEVSSQVVPAQIQPGEPAQVEIELHNPDSLPAWVNVAYGAATTLVYLGADETQRITALVEPLAAGTYTLPVTLSGDLQRMDSLLLTVVERSISPTLQLTGGAPNSGTLVQGQGAGLVVQLANATPATFAASVAYTLTGPLTQVEQAALSLAPGTTPFSMSLAALPTGTYTLAFNLAERDSGHQLATFQRSVQIVAPVLDLALQASTIADPAGMQTVIFNASSAISGTSAWQGNLILDEALVDQAPLTLLPGATATITRAIDLRERSGSQTIHARLVDLDGTVRASTSISLTAAAAFMPQVELLSIASSPATVGSTSTISLTLRNSGAAGPGLLSVTAFDETNEHSVAIDADQDQTLILPVAVPAELVAGTYPIILRFGAQELRHDLHIAGPQLSLGNTLDEPTYEPFSQASWTVQLSGATASATYEVELRYGDQSHTQTISLAAGQVVPLTWTFNVGAMSDRATILVSNHPQGEQSRYTVAIDSRWIPVIEDRRGWLETAQASYLAGETVSLTLHLDAPARAAFVLAPPELATAANLLLWTSLGQEAAVAPQRSNAATRTLALVEGDFTLAYTLPATLPTGRYFFRYFFDGEERTIPIDVFGINISTEQLQIKTANTADRIVSAVLRSDAAIANVSVQAYVLAPDGSTHDLGAGATLITALAPGPNPITLTGAFTPDQLGVHQLVVQVSDATTGMRLGGSASYLETSSASLESFTTDQGVYAPNESGSGSVALYGHDQARLVVRTSGGAVLVDQSLTLTGYQSVSFALDTALAHDEVLEATLTASTGMTATLAAAYKVAESFDIIAPAVQVLAPGDSALVDLGPGSNSITITGIVTEATALATILVNGETATVAGNTWSAAVQIQRGRTPIEIVAIDAAGNRGLGFHTLYGEPAHGLALTASASPAVVGDLVEYQAVLTSTAALTATVRFPFSAIDLEVVSGTASSGELDLEGGVAWQGLVGPDQPVTIRWLGRPTAAGSRRIYAVVQSAETRLRLSNGIQFEVSSGWKIYLPLLRR